ncbi:uncharacterized protein N7506_002150 [Penicillium brevicompactum]|uniref:uncharacterized protein n=1 Tax=Penicillium brevicompactum TaxID=5074 RepID=UPI0025404DB3|nr:uncharacterized protein N7506_002150 [Penicillium brevicompactum]KAJ5348897.1 hypothetical protein N7506_002150 [Penicillium brevicompactum]
MLILWSIIEVSLGAIITCIPTFGPLFKSFATTVSSYRHNASGPSYPLDSIPEGGTKSKTSNNNTSAIFGSHTENTGVTVQSGQRGGLTSHESGSQERILGGDDRTGIYKTKARRGSWKGGARTVPRVSTTSQLLMAALRVSQSSKRALVALRKRPFHIPQDPAPAIPSQRIVDEERSPRYNPEAYYPAKPGEILADKYQLLSKIGWGSDSTSEEAVALKISTGRRSSTPSSKLKIEEKIAQQNPSHKGWGCVRTCLGHFEFAHGEQNHVCQIYQPLRETMELFTKRWENQRMPLPVAKAYILLLLLGMDYLHAECHVAHTDLKLSNILMTFENDKVLPRFMEEHLPNHPMQYKNDPETNRKIYSSLHSLGELQTEDIANMLPQLADFDSAMLVDPIPEDKTKGQTVYLYPIQSPYYRAPEVVCGYGWNQSADIWNFGVLMWNIIEGTELFTQVETSENRYDPKSHVAEMVALLGSPPKAVLKRIESLSQVDFGDGASVTRDDGKECSNSRELFGGPHFDEEGNFLHGDLVPNRTLEDTVPSLEGEEKELFLSFARGMLTWDPMKRKSAGQLAQHPFLNFGDHIVKDIV